MINKGLSLRDTLSRVIFIPVIVLTLILAGLFILSAQLLLTEIRGRQSQVAVEIARQGNLYLNETEDLSHLLTHTLLGMSLEQKKNFLADVRVHYPRFTALYIADRDGRVICESTNGISLIGLDLSRELSFQQAQRLEHTIISQPFISPTTGQVAITLASPITGGDPASDILMVEMDLNLLQRAIERVDTGPGGLAFIVDSTGTLIAYPDSEWVQERRNLSDFKLVRSGLHGMTDFQIFRDHRWPGWMLGTVTSMASNWSVFILQPAQSAARPLFFLVAASLFGYAISLLLMIRVTRRGVQQIVQPITELAQHADSLSRGNYARLPALATNTVRELNILWDSFDRMVETVLDRDRLLEQRVADRTHRLETVATISERLNAILDLNDLINEVVRQIEISFGYPFVSIYLLEEDQNLVIQAASGAAGKQMLQQEYRIQLDGEPSLVAMAAQSKRVVNIPDTSQSPVFLQCNWIPNTRSEICVPILIAEHAIGVIDVQSENVNAFDSSAVDTFRSLASQIGIAIHNAQLYTEMEQLVVQRTSQLVYANQILQNELTERKRAEAERENLLVQVREQAHQVREIMNTVPEGVLLLEADGSIVLTNPVAKEFLASLPGALQGDRISCLGEISLADLLKPTPGGMWREVPTERYIFEAIARPVVDAAQTQRWVLVIRDITQERATQRQVQQQERLAAVGQLAAGIAHDFNNIMAVILLYADIMLNLPDLQLKQRERLNTISQQARRAADLIQQILDFSRRSFLERRPMDLLPLIKEQVKLLQRTLPENIEVSSSRHEGIYTVNADPTRIQQALMNLAFNARDAMPEGGKLRIDITQRSAAAEEIHCVTCGLIREKEWVCISVEDTGQGISPSVIPHIFEPFFTTKPPGKGTGLGLAQVFGIAKQHEGHIDVHSTPGIGSVFSIYLPLVKLEKSARIGSRDSKYLIGDSQLILVVEDEPVTQKAIVEGLSMLNYRVQAVSNGQEALEILEDPAQKVDLVLSDVIMPGISGINLFRTAQQRQMDVPIILMSGHPLQDELEKLQTEGLVGWLMKPPNIEKLSRIVAIALKKL